MAYNPVPKLTNSNALFGNDLNVSGVSTFDAAIKTPLKDGVDGATITFDMDESNNHSVTLGGNRTLAVSNVDAGQKFTIRLKQDVTGSRTVSWWSGITWFTSAGAAPTLKTDPDTIDYIGFICTSGGYYEGFHLTESSSGGGGTASITVEEVDGTPSVSNVNTIVVSNGTLTDDGGGQVTISTGGGGGGVSYSAGSGITIDASDKIHVYGGSGNFLELQMTAIPDTAYPAHQEGVIFYDAENHTLTLYNDEADVSLQLGQEQFLRARNETGATITNGTSVLIYGSHGNAAPTISGAIANSEQTSQVVGLATHDISHNSYGYVTTYGIVRDVDTSAFSAGDEIFLSDTQIGSGTNVSPTIPGYKVTIGHVIRSHGNNGSILVQIGHPKLGGGDLKSELPLNLSGIPFVTQISDTTAGGSQTDPLFIFDRDNRQLRLGSGLQLLDGVPSNTSNVLYNNGGSLYFNGTVVDTDTTYGAGSGLVLAGTEFNVYGGSGNFEYIELTSDNNVTPIFKFLGSGVTDTPIRMKVLSSYASASTSGTALAFEGTQGQLFGITDNLSSGTIFSVNDITGLPLIAVDASGDVKLAQFGRDIIAYKPITIQSGVPSNTTDKLYNDGTNLYFDGSLLGYDDTAISGYFEYRSDSADSDISTVSGLLYDDTAISGYFESRVDSADSTITANSGYFESRVDQNAADIIVVSGLTGGGGGATYSAGSGITIDGGNNINVYGGSGNFEYVELTTDNNALPVFKFLGSGATDTPINLEVRSSLQSATGSGTALLFQGTQGQLFSITDNLSSGTIFNVSDITGLPMLEITASGDVEIGEFAENITIHQPVLMSGGVPSSTTNKLYNNAGTLYFNGSALGGPYDDTYVSGVATYASGQAIQNEADIAYVSGVAVAAGGGTVQGTDGTYDIQPANEGATAGNTRGESSVDLQTQRSAATQVASGGCSTIGGGRNNTASGSGSTVGGGCCNTASGSRSNVSGGFFSTASANFSTVGGGAGNTASGLCSTVSGGYNNTASSSGSTVSGGSSNTASCIRSTVGGGDRNTASGYASTVGGGTLNTASANFSTVGGGVGNTASGTCSTVGGGVSNTAAGTNSTVTGGNKNYTNARHSVVGGHRNVIVSPTNECCSRGATVSGGIGHNSSGGTIDATTGDITGTITCCNAGRFITISGGCRNISTGIGSTVGGGLGNCSSANQTVVAGGGTNRATGNWASILGGSNSQASNSFATIGGGYGQTASGGYSTIGGGNANTSSGDTSFVGGGRLNTASGTCSTVSGGCGNTASSVRSTVGGGSGNTSSGNYTTIGGGKNNTACGYSGTVSGGESNCAVGNFNSTVGGGQLNKACGVSASTVSGGYGNTAAGTNSTVTGGKQNYTDARHSVVGGHRNIIQSPTNECCSRGSTISGGIGHNSSGGTIDATTGDITGTITCCNAGVFSTIGGGCRNVATGACSTISGGVGNTASGFNSTVSGGAGNCASGPNSNVGGGSNSTASGAASTVGGGANNTASGYIATVAGGYANVAYGACSSVGGGLGNRACGVNSTVGGGIGNCALACESTVSGGSSNIAAACKSTVAGGSGNYTNARHSVVAGHKNVIVSPTNECCSRGATVSGGLGHNSSGGTIDATTGDITGTITCCNAGAFSTIGGGCRNVATGAVSTIAGGMGGLASGGQSFVGGGKDNTASSTCATSVGGCGNTASGNISTVVGGKGNTSSGSYSFIGAGSANTASAYFSVVAGGTTNTASANGAVVSGGYSNTASAIGSVVSGGCNNTAAGPCSAIAGGMNNCTTSWYNFVGGGYANCASNSRSSVLGGRENTASGLYSAIGGGHANRAAADGASVTGGGANCACGRYSVALSGSGNYTNARYSVVAGYCNQIVSPTNECCSRAATISGGLGHNSSGGTIDATTGSITGTITCCNAGAFSTIGGGCRNVATGPLSTISGGTGNTASGGCSVVGGGTGNTASTYFSTVSGGTGNTASAYFSTVGGGTGNTASGYGSTVSGGTLNTASAYSSTVGGGIFNTASASHSTVSGGNRGKATRYGETSHAAGRFAADGDAQHTVLVARKSTTDATANQVMFLDNLSARLTIPAETTWMFTIKLAAHNDTNNDGGWWYFRGGIARDGAGNTSLIGSVTSEYSVDSNISTATAEVVADDTNDALEIRVTGVASKSIRWVAVADISQVSWGTP